MKDFLEKQAAIWGKKFQGEQRKEILRELYKSRDCQKEN